jgi:3-hydroxy-3-methylglutaryl CoA synthase
MPVEKPVANFDEDSITMAVAAGMDCINGFDRNAVDALFFATTTSPYVEKQGAATVAAAIDLRRDIITNDFTNSLRAGTLGLRSALDAITAGTAKQVMLTVADCRIGTPRSEFDQASGDGGAAFLLGNDEVIANVLDSYSISEEVQDVWRAYGDNTIRTWEDRFVYETGYLKIMPEAVAGLMKKMKMTPKDITKAVLYGPNPRRHSEMVRMLGLDAKAQVQDPLFGRMNNTGAAFILMQLIAALETAKPGDKILMVSYGDGADAYLLEVTDEITKLAPRRGIKRLLDAKRILPDHATYMRWREASSNIAGAPPSVSARWREREEIDRLHASKCKSCGLIQYPPQRVCTRCHTKDQWSTVRLSDKKGKIFTFSLDYVAPSVDIPLAITIVNFDGGGRGLFMATDRELSEIKCEAPVEMSFRKLRSSGGVHNYYWKPMPLRV